MFKKAKKKTFEEMTIMEKDAEIKRLEKVLKRKTVFYKLSIPLAIISMTSTVGYIAILLLSCAKKIKPGGWITADLMVGLMLTAFITMIISVHIFVPVYWVKFIRSAFEGHTDDPYGDTGADLLVAGVLLAFPIAVVIIATFFAPGFYCLKRTSDLKKSVAELTSKIKDYKAATYPYDGDFEILSAYRM